MYEAIILMRRPKGIKKMRIGEAVRDGEYDERGAMVVGERVRERERVSGE